MTALLATLLVGILLAHGANARQLRQYGSYDYGTTPTPTPTSPTPTMTYYPSTPTPATPTPSPVYASPTPSAPIAYPSSPYTTPTPSPYISPTPTPTPTPAAPVYTPPASSYYPSAPYATPNASPSPSPAVYYSPVYGSSASPAPVAPAPGPAPPVNLCYNVTPWAIPNPSNNLPPYPTNLTCYVGQTVYWSWTSTHGLWRSPNSTCPDPYPSTNGNDYERILAPAPSGFATYTFGTPGIYWFQCPVPGHCPAGMNIKFNVTAPPPPQVYAVNWALGQTYPDGSARVGDAVTFTWSGTHGLYKIPNITCPASYSNTPPLEELKAATPNSSYTYTFPAPGIYWFACPVAGHCDGGMKIKWVVS